MKFLLAAIATLYLGFTSVPSNAAEKWFPFPVEVWNKPFDFSSSRTDKSYVALKRAQKKWHIFLSIPHMKDAYWIAVNYGAISEAQRLGIKLSLFEADGYSKLVVQKNQINDCVKDGADGVIISAASYKGLNKTVEDIAAKNIPVVDLINGIESNKISAKSIVNFMTWVLQQVTT